jgi:hypothetical protein
MRPQRTYISATALCALALILACPPRARATGAAPGAKASIRTSETGTALGKTQKSNASHARAGASQASAPQPGSSQTLRPDAVDCVFAQQAAGTSVHPADRQRTKPKPLEKWIELAPGVNPESACPRGSVSRGFSYNIRTLSAALRNGRVHLESTDDIPPPGKSPATGAGHPP